MVKGAIPELTIHLCSRKVYVPFYRCVAKAPGSLNNIPPGSTTQRTEPISLGFYSTAISSRASFLPQNGLSLYASSRARLIIAEHNPVSAAVTQSRPANSSFLPKTFFACIEIRIMTAMTCFKIVLGTLAGCKTKIEQREEKKLFLKVFTCYANPQSKDFQGNCSVK